MILGFSSGAGGTGKTMLATNIAWYYAINQNKKVLIIDADWGVSNTHYAFNVYPKYSVGDFLKGQVSWADVKCRVNTNIDLISVGYAEKEIADIEEQKLDSFIAYVKGESHNYDFIIIDSAPGIHKPILKLLFICGQVIVLLTSDPKSIANGYALMKLLFNEYNYDGIVKAVVNMESNKELALNNFDTVNATSKKYLGRAIGYLGNINSSNYIKSCIKNKEIFMQRHKDHTVDKQIKSIGDLLWQQVKIVNS